MYSQDCYGRLETKLLLVFMNSDIEEDAGSQTTSTAQLHQAGKENGRFSSNAPHCMKMLVQDLLHNKVIEKDFSIVFLT